MCVPHIYGMGVHMRIMGVHACAKEIRVRRAKVRACGRSALGKPRKVNQTNEETSTAQENTPDPLQSEAGLAWLRSVVRQTYLTLPPDAV